jgi:DNA-binding response OmpR family regulator
LYYRIIDNNPEINIYINLFFSNLWANLFTRNIPVIAVTGLTNLYHQAMIRSAGFEDYICKPFLLEELEDKLTKYLSPCLI